MADIGHNSTKFAKDQLKSIIERIENVEGQVKELNKDKAEIYLEAKGNGYDVTAIRAIVRMRKQDAQKRAEQESILEVYMQALGMLADLPLGQAAMQRDGVRS